jgi:transposase
MGRSLKIRKPRKTEIRKLHQLLAEALASWQCRRAETILLYEGGLSAIDIAQLLEVHINTIYNDLRVFDKAGLGAITQPRSVGAPGRITEKQVAEVLRLAHRAPYEIGLPYGRWSLSKFRDYLIQHRIVKKVSRKHLWRLLQKGGCTFGALNASSSARIHGAGRF